MLRAGVITLALTVLISAVPAQAGEEGVAVFRGSCVACHSFSQNRVGPGLAGVVGRPAATAPGYVYSAAMRNSGIVWTEDKLDAFLAAPQTVVPGTKMTFMGIRDSGSRAALIAYLKAQQPVQQPQ
jgi:cytochrome c2